jgi:hypothetical protein
MLKRLATFAAIGLFSAVPLAATLGATPAFADASVTFSGGGLGLLLCGSKPDTSQITVGAETKIRLTNGLGGSAQLKIDGTPSATLAGGETVEVQFHRGPVSITMVPGCPLNLNTKYEPLTVQVNAPPAPVQTTSAAKPPSAKPSATTAPAPGAPGTGEGGLPALPAETLFPDQNGVFASGSPAPGGGMVDASPATVVNPDGSPARVAETRSLDKGPIGLLAIIATVCVVGVSAGVIRAIITQRATRLELA